MRADTSFVSARTSCAARDEEAFALLYFSAGMLFNRKLR